MKTDKYHDNDSKEEVDEEIEIKKVEMEEKLEEND